MQEGGVGNRIRQLLRDRRVVACALFLGVAATSLVVAWSYHRANAERHLQRLQQAVGQLADSLDDRLEAYEHGLRGARGAIISAGPQLSRERFAAYSRSRDYAREFPGIRGFGYVQRVPSGQEAAFVQHARMDGMPDFAVHALGPNAGERFLIRYLEPVSSNRPALGLDIASEENRRRTAMVAAMTGQAALSPPITLVQAEGRANQGFMLLLPVYREEAGRPLGDNERWAATQGWAYAPLTADAILGPLDGDGQLYSLALSDLGGDGRPGPFYRGHDFDALAGTNLTAQRDLPIHGRTWRLQVRGRPAQFAALGLTPPWLAGTVTMFLGSLSIALWYLIAVLRERRRAGFLQQARLAAMVSDSTDAIIGCDMQGRVVLWNATAERTLGHSAQEAQGRLVHELVVDEHGDNALPANVADAHGSQLHLRRKDGGAVDMVAIASVIRDAKGVATGVSLFLHDITQHIRSEEQFRRVIEASPSAILMVDEGGIIRLTNAKAEELFGHAREDLLGQPVDMLLPTEAQDRHGAYMANYFANPETRVMGAGRDLYCLRGDGTRIPVEIGLNPISLADGRYALAFIIDITERKRHEESIMRLNASLEQQVLERTEQIRTYSSRLGAILEHAGYAIIATDSNGRITLFNPAAERMLGYSAAEMVDGKNIDCLHDDKDLWSTSLTLSARHDRHVAASFVRIAEVSAHSGGDIEEWTYVRKDGTRLPVALNVSMLRDAQGEASGFLVMAADLTEQKRRDSELHQAISTAEQANRSKSDFLANMSHEIRTPMNAILGMLYLLDRVELPAVAQDMIRKINLAARSLLSIINDVLDFSKIEAGRIELEDAPFDLAEVLDNVAALMASAVDAKTVEMLVAPAPEGARHVRGDALRLGQVLVNLVSNAIKFTERGEVALTVERLPHAGEDKVRLFFCVADTGIGISAEKQRMIFSPFSQVDSSTTRKFGGTGLGLSISNRLVQLMGGELGVDSAPGKGSRFHFEVTLPLASPPADTKEGRGTYHILIVDDHDMARDNLSLIVRGFGWTADPVESGEQALDVIDRGEATSYDIILMDWQMPGIDGLKAAADIRSRLGTSRQPIIIMVTAFERKLIDYQDRRDAVDAVLTKPVTASVLYNAINEALARRHRGLRAWRAAASPGRRLAGYRLLVVDDSEINREVAQRILEGEGALVDQAEDGREALGLLQADPDRFDVVLMDVQMPQMDGYEATRRIRQTPRLAGLPVIALTAGAFKSQQDAALEAGMNAFVAKPFEVPDLIEAIVRSTPGRFKREPDEIPASTPPEMPAFVVAEAEDIDPQLLDVEKGLSYWREEAPYRRYLSQFARRYGGQADALEDSLKRNDAAQACADMHKMHGAAASLALPGLVAISAEIEGQLRQGANVDDLLPSLRLTLEETLQDIEQYVAYNGDGPHSLSSGVQQEDPVASLQRLQCALDSDDPEAIEQALAGLSTELPCTDRDTLARHVEEFDYRGAEAYVRAMLETLERNSAAYRRDGDGTSE